jgi:hypothetical protein
VCEDLSFLKYVLGFEDVRHALRRAFGGLDEMDGQVNPFTPEKQLPRRVLTAQKRRRRRSSLGLVVKITRFIIFIVDKQLFCPRYEQTAQKLKGNCLRLGLIVKVNPVIIMISLPSSVPVQDDERRSDKLRKAGGVPYLD